MPLVYGSDEWTGTTLVATELPIRELRQPASSNSIQGGTSMQAYCLKCRSHRDINDAEQVTFKNGRPATRGKCSVCNSTVFRIGKAE
jgi:hypothetical protein